MPRRPPLVPWKRVRVVRSALDHGRPLRDGRARRWPIAHGPSRLQCAAAPPGRSSPAGPRGRCRGARDDEPGEAGNTAHRRVAPRRTPGVGHARRQPAQTAWPTPPALARRRARADREGLRPRERPTDRPHPDRLHCHQREPPAVSNAPARSSCHWARSPSRAVASRRSPSPAAPGRSPAHAAPSTGASTTAAPM